MTETQETTFYSGQKILMCAPQFFGVDYVINPWMLGQQGQVNHERAHNQWTNLVNAMKAKTNIDLIEPQPGLPDFVFTANAGLVHGNKAIISHFHNPERQREEPHWHTYFSTSGFSITPWPQEIAFEGAGDALFDRGMPRLWVGYGFRSDASVADRLHAILGVETVPLQLINPRFYHLDTCFCPLEGGYILYYPGAFSSESRLRIEKLIPPEKRIIVDETDAHHFICNATNIGHSIFTNHASPAALYALSSAGFTTTVTPVDEFLKAGGGVKCLTLKLVE